MVKLSRYISKRWAGKKQTYAGMGADTIEAELMVLMAGFISLMTCGVQYCFTSVLARRFEANKFTYGQSYAMN